MNVDVQQALVDCDWLSTHLGAAGTVVIDASYFLPAQGRDGAVEYRKVHIPGAGFFDIDAIADSASALPHMLPTAEQFAAAVGKLGIGNSTHVVAYDDNSFMASARAWWMFRVFGHDRVSVLDGGLGRWRAMGGALESGICAPSSLRTFVPTYRSELVRDLAAVQAHLERNDAQIIDARSPGRFAGSEPEPRPGLRSGHIPNSVNVFFKALIDPESGKLKPPPALAEVFASAGVHLDRPMVASCGTGVTACVLALAAFALGQLAVAVYDGSWTEWGAQGNTPVQTCA